MQECYVDTHHINQYYLFKQKEILNFTIFRQLNCGEEKSILIETFLPETFLGAKLLTVCVTICDAQYRYFSLYGFFSHLESVGSGG